MALSWAAWIIISIILTCCRWWYLLLGLLVLRPSISSLLQSATSVITKCERYYKVRHYNCIVPTNVRWCILYVWRMQNVTLANMEFKAYVMVYWPFFKIRYPLTSVINMTGSRALGFHLIAGSNTCKIWLVLKKTTLDQRIRFRLYASGREE